LAGCLGFERHGSVTQSTRFGRHHVESSYPTAPPASPGGDAVIAAAQEPIDGVVVRKPHGQANGQKQQTQPKQQKQPKRPARKRVSAEVGQSDALEAPSAA